MIPPSTNRAPPAATISPTSRVVAGAIALLSTNVPPNRVPATSRATSGAFAGGLFAYYHISYYPAHPFGPHWTFDALLMTFIGGVGTLQGPVLGAVLYVTLKEYLALRWVDIHLLIFGALFVAIVLLLPGGLVQAAERARGLLGGARGPA